MLYVAHAYEPSAVLQTLVLQSFLPTGPCLALIKHSTVEFLSLGADDTKSAAAAGLLESIQSVTLNARILAAQVVVDRSANGSPTQSILILTDHYQPRLISLAASVSSQTGETTIDTTATLALDEVARSPAESALSVWVEPSSSTAPNVGQRIALSHVYKGIMKAVPLSSTLTQSGRSTSDDADEIMDDVSQSNSHSRAAHFSQSFGIRLPHPNLISCAVLSPVRAASLPAVALLSVSSVPSKIPALASNASLCFPSIPSMLLRKTYRRCLGSTTKASSRRQRGRRRETFRSSVLLRRCSIQSRYQALAK